MDGKRSEEHFEADEGRTPGPRKTEPVEPESEPRHTEPVADDASRGPGLPLSFGQQRIWFLDRFEPAGDGYVLAHAVRIAGHLDHDALQEAFTALVRRHGSLRTCYVQRADGTVEQIIAEPWPMAVPVEDLSGEPESTRAQAAYGFVKAASREPFDLTSGRLIRARLVRVAGDEHLLLVCAHHIAADERAVQILADELRSLYAARTGGRRIVLPEPSLAYSDFALWQRELLQGDVLDAQLVHWRDRLAGVAPLALPTDRPRTGARTQRGAVVRFAVPDETAAALREVARRCGSTVFTVHMAAFQILLAKYTGQRDIAVGTPVANRTDSALEDIVGFFTNTVVVRSDLSGNPTFEQVLEQVHARMLDAYDNLDLPFDRIVEELAPERDLSRTPLFQAMLVFNEGADKLWSIDGLEVEPLDLGVDISRFDLTLRVREASSGPQVSIEYDTDLFDASRIQRMAGHYQTLLAGIARQPNAALGELTILTKAELELLRDSWSSGERVEYPAGQTFPALFEQCVRANAARFAASCGGARLTFAELNAGANQLAHRLRRLGVGPETTVALCVQRSLEMLVGVLGILKAGGGYVALDPDGPASRQRFVLEDTGAQVVVTQPHLIANFLGCDRELLLLDPGLHTISAEPTHNLCDDPANTVRPEHLAYVIYTSGSTGRPKGVEVTHRSLADFLASADAAFPAVAGAGYGSAVFSSPAFDLPIPSMMLPLIQGQEVLVLGESGPAALRALATMFAEHGSLSTLKVTPSHLELLVDEMHRAGALIDVGTLVIAGEPLSSALARRARQVCTARTALVNEYGPTETTVGATLCPITDDALDAAAVVPIGRPMANTDVHVVDRFGSPTPIGVTGELVIGGAGVARGYLGRPQLTAQKFVKHPFRTDSSTSAYRTGDLVRWLERGDLDFVGRADHQVKLRGYRVELGEIEAVLLEQPAIDQAVVILREDVPGDKRLIAYCKPAAGSTAGPATIREECRDGLPAHMVPSAVVLLDELPLNANGKVDRDALPVPESASSPEDGYVAPRTPAEAAIAQVLGAVLGVERMGVYDDFFQVGGHSMLAVRVVRSISDALGVELDLRDVFECPSAHLLAARIAQAGDRPAL